MHLRNTSVGTTSKEECQEEEDSLDDLEMTTLERLQTVFEVLFHSSLDFMRSVVLTLFQHCYAECRMINIPI
jgi:hypothetical protein